HARGVTETPAHPDDPRAPARLERQGRERGEMIGPGVNVDQPGDQSGQGRAQHGAILSRSCDMGTRYRYDARMKNLLLLAILLCSVQDPETQGYPKGTKNTEDPKNVPLAPAEAFKLLQIPDGFHATLFAAEPDVAQPISMAFDERGRLWVAECYSYE